MYAYQEDGGPRNLMIILGKESYHTSLRFRLRAGFAKLLFRVAWVVQR